MINTLSINLRKYRKALGMSQKVFAQRSSINSNYLCKIELGKVKNVGVARIESFANVLGITICDLLRGEDEPSTSSNNVLLNEDERTIISLLRPYDSNQKSLIGSMLQAFLRNKEFVKTLHDIMKMLLVFSDQRQFKHRNVYKKLIDLEKKISLFLSTEMDEDCKRMILSILYDYKDVLMEKRGNQHTHLT